MTRTLGLIAIAFFFLHAPIAQAEDPCAMALSKVDPGGAASIMADEQKARQKAQEDFDHAKSPDGDAQWKPRDSGKIADVGADHHEMETPLYASGIGIATAQGDFVTAGILSQCVARRSAQMSADRDAAEKNKAIADKATQEDKNNLDPHVIYVDKELAARAGR